MVIATLDHCLKYANCHPGLSAGFHFLKHSQLSDFADGKHEIDGDKLLAIFAHDTGRSRDGAYLEFHRRYIDIQFVISGNEVMGWQPLESCRQVKQEYDPDRDLGFFLDRPISWFEVPPGSFTVFFPEDAHAPLAGTGSVHKVVLKVAV